MKIKSMSERLKEQIKKQAYSIEKVDKAKERIGKKIEEITDVDNGSFYKLRMDIFKLQDILRVEGCTSDKIDEIVDLMGKLEHLLNDWKEEDWIDITKIKDSIKEAPTKAVWDSSRPFGK